MILRSDTSWHGARIGKLTASNMWKAMSFLRNGAPSETRNKYMAEIVAERMTGFAVSHYISPAMQWGIDNQAGAISEFEAATGLIVWAEAFFDHPEIAEFGATPDGLMGDLEGCSFLEVKCPLTSTHIIYLKEQQIPMEYQYQMAAQALCVERLKGYFVSFDPRVKRAGRLLILEFIPSGDFLNKTLEGAKQFLLEADQLFSRVTEESYES